MINFPTNCLVNKFIPKKIFYEKINLSNNLKNDFVNYIDKIIWLYKLSESTIGISKTEKICEIEVFQINLKVKEIPKKIIGVITKIIEYPILFVFKYNNDFCYSVKLEDVYYSDWNDNIIFDLEAINLQVLYEKIIKKIITKEENAKNLQNIIIENKRKKELECKINNLVSKIKKEKQFNKKVELNLELQKLNKEMEVYNNE